MKNLCSTLIFVIIVLHLFSDVYGQNVPLNPKFSASNSSICPDNIVHFIDSSQGNMKEWNWTFSGGTPSSSNEKNPVVKYSTSGSFDVKLTITDSLGNSKSKIEYTYIKVNGLVKASFTYGSIDSNCGDTEFWVNTHGDSVSYSWDFGDGSISTDPDPIHKFPQEGEYNVKLCLEGPCNKDCISKTIGIYCVPIADFTSDAKVVCAGNKVKYSSLSTDNVLHYVWSFPEGSPSGSFEKDPIIQYNKKGIYKVKLVVSSSKNNAQKLVKSYIKVRSPIECPPKKKGKTKLTGYDSEL